MLFDGHLRWSKASIQSTIPCPVPRLLYTFILKSTCYYGIAWYKRWKREESILQSSSINSIATNDVQFHEITREASSQTFRTTKRKPPIAIYIEQLLHLQTKRLDLAPKMSHCGLSLSPERLLDISTTTGNKAIVVFGNEVIAYPLNLRHDLFTTAATDNLEVNPSSATASMPFMEQLHL